MLNGSQSMHAVSDDGISVASADGDEVLSIHTLDAPLVSPGHPTPLPNGIRPPDLAQGMHFNLVNNAWGTNYVSSGGWFVSWILRWLLGYTHTRKAG